MSTQARCHNCGETGHFARSCPAHVAATSRPVPLRKPIEVQEMITLRGRIKMAAAKAGNLDLLDAAAAVTEGSRDEDVLTAGLAARAAELPGFEVVCDYERAGRRPAADSQEMARRQAAAFRASKAVIPGTGLGDSGATTG